MRRLLLAAITAATLPIALAAQEDGTGHPDGWSVRTDRPDQSAADIAFMDMPPGWHVTTGPAAILWEPTRTASGDFSVEMESYLFDPRGRREAFGFFVGGRNLEDEDQSYVYFLVREGGEFLVKRRVGGGTEVIVDWSPAPSMVSYADRGEEATAKNVLRLEAGTDHVRFLVNGEEVGSVPRASLPELDGVVGLRVNHGLNIHVSRLDVEAGGA